MSLLFTHTICLKNFTFPSLPSSSILPCSPAYLLLNLLASRVGGRYFLLQGREHLADSSSFRCGQQIEASFWYSPTPETPFGISTSRRPFSSVPAPPPRPRRQVLGARSPGLGRTPRASDAAGMTGTGLHGTQETGHTGRSGQQAPGPAGSRIPWPGLIPPALPARAFAACPYLIQVLVTAAILCV